MESLFTKPIRDEDFARCCVAGIWLQFGFLHESHEISQSIKTQDGSYWHGLMHREEGDYWNSKYWFERVGEHPIHTRYSEAGFELPPEFFSEDVWQASAFVDFCEAAESTVDLERTELRDVWKRREWEYLLEYCVRLALDERNG